MTYDSGTPPAGWYDDPSQQGRQRYWDGEAWTTETRSSASDLPPPSGAPGRVSGGSWDWQWLFFNFEGRAHRAHFWGGLVALWGLGLVSVATAAALGGAAITSIVRVGLVVVFIWAGLAIQVKRWHDRDKSGWWVLIGVVPIVGPIWVLVEAGFLEGTRGPNRFGADPRV